MLKDVWTVCNSKMVMMERNCENNQPTKGSIVFEILPQRC